MVMGKVSATTPVTGDNLIRRENGRDHCPDGCEERIKAQLARWEKMFSKDDFDVGCAKSAQHRSWLNDDKPFRERAR